MTLSFERVREMSHRNVIIIAVLCLFLFVSCSERADIVITPAAEAQPSRMAPSDASAAVTDAVLKVIENEVTSAETLAEAAPEISAEPETSAIPETEPAPETTAAPETTSPPETTAAPETSAPPETTAVPETTAAAAIPETTLPPETEPPVPSDEAGGIHVVFNTNSRKYHTHADCSYAVRISAENRQERTLTPATLERSGYTICSFCKKADERPETTAAERTAPLPAPEVPQTAAPAPETEAQKKTPRQAALDELSSLAAGDIHAAVNISSKKYHTSDGCSYAAMMNAENRADVYIADISALDALGYSLCSFCAKAAEASDPAVRTIAPETVPETAAPTQPLPAEAAPETAAPEAPSPTSDGMITVVINKSSKTFHISESCSSVSSMKEENKLIIQVAGEAGILELIAQGYKPCGRCAKAYAG